MGDISKIVINDGLAHTIKDEQGQINIKILNGKVSENAEAISNLKEKLEEVFQYVSDGKELIASAITDKGVYTEDAATFDTMADNVDKIQGGPSKSIFTEERIIDEVGINSLFADNLRLQSKYRKSNSLSNFHLVNKNKKLNNYSNLKLEVKYRVDG